MTNTVRLPRTIAAATSHLAGVDRLVVAKEWERAAIVAAFTYPSKGGRGNLTSSSEVLSVIEFSRLGISGLRSQDTVRRYRNAWLTTGRVAAPGKTVDLEGLGTFPPHQELADTDRREALNAAAEAEGAALLSTQQVATHLSALRAAIKADPKVAAEARKALDERYEDAAKPILLTKAPGPVELVYEFRRLHRSVDAIISLVIEGKAIVSDAEREAVLREVQWLRTALGYIEDGVRADTLDEALAQLLEAGS